NISPDRLMTESDLPRPYKHYGLSKYKAECIVNQAYREGRIKTTIIRPCWFYGPGQPERQTRFFRMIKSGRPIIFGDGKNLRSMSYIDNVIEGLLLVEEKDIAIGQTYWIADRRPYPVIEIYQTIANLLNVEIKPRVIPRFSSTLFEAIDTILQGLGMYSPEIHVAGEMAKDIACSIKKAEEELGYNPKIELEEGMRRSIEWCRENGIEI
ncbi:MAG: NAD(P)-dependent oxidoreductase, partial [Candidatus Omnitrophica bacterium]|nr:NAD(P)-dependent oxidoreductase [Candidatus Omnitrophota bacterium]